MKRIFALIILAAILLVGCGTANSNVIETRQQDAGTIAIVQNQPVPDIGGYSFERQIVIETFIARNNTIATYSYLMTLDGRIIEICPSIGYPIPYSTQVTSPEKLANNNPQHLPSYDASVIPQSEPNGLYAPDNAAATFVQCVNADGSVSPAYIEQDVMAFPFRIKSDFQLERIGETSFKVDATKK